MHRLACLLRPRHRPCVALKQSVPKATATDLAQGVSTATFAVHRQPPARQKIRYSPLRVSPQGIPYRGDQRQRRGTRCSLALHSCFHHSAQWARAIFPKQKNAARETGAELAVEHSPSSVGRLLQWVFGWLFATGLWSLQNRRHQCEISGIQMGARGVVWVW
jgi:hypothetical protein